jgi:hypothetical protein
MYIYRSTSSHMLPKHSLLIRPIKRIIKNTKIDILSLIGVTSVMLSSLRLQKYLLQINKIF